MEPVNILALGKHCSHAIVLVLSFGSIFVTGQESGGRRRPGLTADIPVPVLQVPAGEEGRPGGLQNNRKEEEEKEEEMDGKRRDEEEVQDRQVVEEVMMVNFPLIPFPFVFSLCCSSFIIC